MQKEPSSFRDPSGYVYREDNVIYRFVAKSYAASYDLLLSSGLYDQLTSEGLLITHQEIAKKNSDNQYRILKPEVIPFISYPYEWSFDQLKDAALVILLIQEKAMQHGMSLKDASAYNIQFLTGKPILIDTLSFEPYKAGIPWVAYRQFCQHFLAPLALMAKVDISLRNLSQLDVNGISLELTAALLPKRTKFSFGLGSHLHLHASGGKAQSRVALDRQAKVSKTQLLGILSSLRSTILGLRQPKQVTAWHGYYQNTNYSDQARLDKEAIITRWIKRCQPNSVWDAGANDARFSQLASKQGIWTLATDIDAQAVNDAYLLDDKNLLPLVIDLVNPSPAVGWANQERRSFLERVAVDLSLCLALVHHLAIQYGMPLERIAELFAGVSRYLIIEFVPKADSKVTQLLQTREDIFSNYTKQGFEQAFTQYFKLLEQKDVIGSHRTLYLLERKSANVTAKS